MSTLKGYVDAQTSAWVKTVLDPAHAREYGCVGVPDENKLPTLVGTDRYTVTLNARSAGDAGRFVSMSSGTIVTDLRDISVEKLTILNSNEGYFFVIWYVTGVSGGSSGSYIGISRHDGKLAPATTFYQRARRTVSSSLTVDCIGQVMYTGGYFETGYFPQASGDSATSSGDTFPIRVNAESTYATRVASYQHGAYTVSRINNYDWARVWNRDYTGVPVTLFDTARETSGGRELNASASIPQSPDSLGKCGFDQSYVCYYPSGTSEWVLRVTLSHVVEIQTPFAEGGTDGAKYDPRAVEAFMAISDVVPFTWDASDNDLRAVVGKLKQFVSRNGDTIKGILSTLPYGRTWSAVLDAVVYGKAATKRRKRRAGKALREAIVASALAPSKRAAQLGRRPRRKATLGPRAVSLPLVPATASRL